MSVAAEQHDVGADELLAGLVRGDSQVHGHMVTARHNVGSGL